MRKYIILLISLIFIAIACNKKITETVSDANSYPLLNQTFQLSEEYVESIMKWREGRYESITGPKGWLSLVGLYWLKEGENTIGRSPENDIVLTDLGLDEAGSFILDNGNIKLTSKGEAFIQSKMKPEIDGTIKHDGQGSPTVLNTYSYFMHVIKRGNQYGLRVKNTIAEKRYRLPEIPNFDIDSSFVKYAQFVKAPIQEKLSVETVIGINTEFTVSGYFQFLHEGQLIKLMAFDGGEDYFFIIFKDQSSGGETYGGGRFLDVKKSMDENQILFLDFNKAYNPPCAFSDYATCPLPPIENHLDFYVEAGEKLPQFDKN